MQNIRNSARISGTYANRSQTPLGTRSYSIAEGGNRRHEFTAGGPNVGTPNAIQPNNWFAYTLLSFKRAFAGTDNSGPTATASNNFQTASVFNGSPVTEYETIIRLKNESPNTKYLDVYEVCCSFYDALVWQNIGDNLVTFDSTSIGPPDIRGEVDWVTPTGINLFSNTHQNFKQLQHYLKKIAVITLGSISSGDSSAEITINQVPPKVKRSQTGMFWGYVFHSDIAKNGSAVWNCSFNAETKFLDAPVAQRQPYKY